MLGEPGHGKSSLCKKIVSNFRDKKFCPNRIKKVFSFSLNPTAWIKKLENPLDVKNIFIIPHEQIMSYGKYQDVIFGKEHLEGGLIFLDGYDELYLRLQENSKNTISFLEDLENIAKNWDLKFIITSRKTCIDISDLYTHGYRICQLTKLTKNQQIKWINNVYNKKLFPEKPYDINKMYNIHQDSNVQFKVLELLEIPILLQLIVSKYFYGDAQNIAELYDKLFEEILNTRKEITIGSFDEDKTEEFKQIFELYAYNIYKNNDTYTIVESQELEKEENTKWKSLLLFYITSEKKQKEYYIEFIHRSFYQYFQAWYFYHLVLGIKKEIYKIKSKELDYVKIIIQDRNKIADLFETEIKVKNKTANLFKAICWRKIENDVIDIVKQINQNQKQIQIQIQIQNQINYILDIFEKTDGIITGKGGKWCLPVGQGNILDKMEILIYNLLTILNIVLPNGLIISKYKRIGQLIKKWDINDIYLPKINISNLNLNKVNFTRANLQEANLERANLVNANLINANLEGANLTKANLEKTNFKKVRLINANLKNSNLERANLKGADLQEANLTGTNLKWTNLVDVNLEGINLENANLKEADLENANFKRVSLINANLKGANLTKADLKWANLERTNFRKAHLEEANIVGANLERANLTEAHLKKANLKWTNLEWANLKGTHLSETSLRKANLRKVNFDPIILKDAILEDTKISRERYNEIAALGIDVNKIIWCD